MGLLDWLFGSRNDEVGRGDRRLTFRADDPRELHEAMKYQEGIKTGRHGDVRHVELVVPRSMVGPRSDWDAMKGRSDLGGRVKRDEGEMAAGRFADGARRDKRFSWWVEDDD